MANYEAAIHPAALRIAVFASFLIPTIVSANPIVDPRDQVHQGIVLGLLALAITIEVAVTAPLLMLVCQIEQRVILVLSLVVVNIATFITFVFYLYPKIESIIVVEVLVLLAEAFAIVHITRLLSERPLAFRHALAAVFLGNAFSFIVGLAA